MVGNIVKPMKKIWKILFLIWTPFNRRDYRRFGIELLQKNGFQVGVWDFTHLLNVKEYKTVKVPDPIKFEGHKTFFLKNDAVQALESLGPEILVVCMIPYCFDTYSLFKALSKSKAQYCTHSGSIPVPPRNLDKRNLNKRDLLSKLNRLSAKRIANRLFNTIPYKLLGIKSASFVLATGGDQSILNAELSDDRTETIKGHSWDYDIYLKLKKGNASDGGIRTAVFIDEYLPFHPDFINLIIEPPITPDEYYPPLLEFFRFIESEYGLKVIIAAHPRSIYETYPDYFERYEVIQGRTAELIKNTEVVLLHSSTAVNFAVLFQKPAVFLNWDPNNKTVYGPYIRKMASIFNKEPVNIFNAAYSKLPDFFKVEEDLYKVYIDRYIKTKNTPDLLFWEIFSNRINNYSSFAPLKWRKST